MNVVHLTFHLQTEKVVTFVSEIVFTQCINSLKIAIIVYRFIKNSAGMMLTNEIEHYMQQWNYIEIRQANKKGTGYEYDGNVFVARVLQVRRAEAVTK